MTDNENVLNRKHHALMQLPTKFKALLYGPQVHQCSLTHLEAPTPQTPLATPIQPLNCDSTDQQTKTTATGSNG